MVRKKFYNFPKFNSENYIFTKEVKSETKATIISYGLSSKYDESITKNIRDPKFDSRNDHLLKVKESML
ncbi:hypothetical protein SAMN05192588_1128 [Nonlabens sp. Hel1_33_55]|nr:hypothetical protein SAMN05192588_1128 [Nonlabens sp. Hel1_33_55]